MPADLEKLPPVDRFNEKTSESMKLGSRLLKMVPGLERAEVIAPVVLQNSARTLGGGLLDMYLRVFDEAVVRASGKPDKRPARNQLADIPIVGRFFVRYPSAGMEKVATLGPRRKQLAQKFEAAKRYLAAFEVEEFRRRAEEALGDGSLAASLGAKGLMPTIEKLQAAVDRITLLPGDVMSPDEKRVQIDRILHLVGHYAKLAHDVMDRLERKIEDRQDPGSDKVDLLLDMAR